MFALYPPADTPLDEIANFTKALLRHFVTPNQNPLLLLTHTALGTFEAELPALLPVAQAVFRRAVAIGRRGDIRSVFRIAVADLGRPQYRDLVMFLGDYAEGNIGSKELQVTPGATLAICCNQSGVVVSICCDASVYTCVILILPHHPLLGDLRDSGASHQPADGTQEGWGGGGGAAV